MTNIELITKIFEDMMELADLHKPDLESTESFPQYNKATSQVVILESLNGMDNNDRMLKVLSSFLEGKDKFWDEFLQMIDNKHLPEATEIYQRIITRATELTANLETVAPLPEELSVNTSSIPMK